MLKGKEEPELSALMEERFAKGPLVGRGKEAAVEGNMAEEYHGINEEVKCFAGNGRNGGLNCGLGGLNGGGQLL